MSGRILSRRFFLAVTAVFATFGAVAFVFRRKIISLLSRWTRLDEFSATPPLVPHDPAHDSSTIYTAQGGTPAENIDAVLAKMDGIESVVGTNDVVIIKVSAQWWNQGMTNVAAVKRTIEHILTIEGFDGEVIVFENVHFRLADGSGLARAWTHESERNVDVEGWNKLGDLIAHFEALGAPVSFVGLIDAGENELATSGWHDPDHQHGVYGGDGRGPIQLGEDRDGYCWDFDNEFRVQRSMVDDAKVPLTWPVFTSPHSGLVVDLRAGLFRRESGGRVPVEQPLTFINMTTANEHASVGFTGATKSSMGLVDMSAGYAGTHPLTDGYMSVHYFGHPDAKWRMAGPLAHFAKEVRTPDLFLTVAEWVALTPAEGGDQSHDIRHDSATAVRSQTVVAGTDPVAIDVWCIRNLLMPLQGANQSMYDLDDESSSMVAFLRYYREVYGSGTLDESLVTVV